MLLGHIWLNPVSIPGRTHTSSSFPSGDSARTDWRLFLSEVLGDSADAALPFADAEDRGGSNSTVNNLWTRLS